MKKLFGAVIVTILLGLYIYLIWLAVSVAECINTPGCQDYTSTSFTETMAQTLSVISGLISALVIAELTITKRGEVPAQRMLEQGSSTVAMTILKSVSIIYLVAWLATGLWAFVTGLFHSTGLPALTNLGQAWLGLAIAAAYAYFGIEPQRA